MAIPGTIILQVAGSGLNQDILHSKDHGIVFLFVNAVFENCLIVADFESIAGLCAVAGRVF